VLEYTRKNENIDYDCFKDTLGRKEVLLVDRVDCDGPGKPPPFNPCVQKTSHLNLLLCSKRFTLFCPRLSKAANI
jgi:hypothetical protein